MKLSLIPSGRDPAAVLFDRHEEVKACRYPHLAREPPRHVGPHAGRPAGVIPYPSFGRPLFMRRTAAAIGASASGPGYAFPATPTPPLIAT